MAITITTRRLCLLAAFVTALSAGGVASAHEHREVGKYEFIVGFQNEPALVNQPNGISLRVVDTSAQTEDEPEGKPVEGLEKTLKAEVIQGNDTMSVPLRAAFGEPGTYLGDFIPTKEGDYIFHFTGTINGEAIDERFESGPDRFSSVEGITELQFPEKQPSMTELQSSLADARDTASQARMIGYVGLGVGTLGLLAALAALANRGRRARTVPAARSEDI